MVWPRFGLGLNLNEIILFLMLDSAEDFHDHKIWIIFVLSRELPLKPLNTRDVSLTSSNIDASSVATFLQSFHSLRQYRYDYKNDDNTPPELVLSAFGQGLARLTHCLEDLVITIIDEK